MHHTSLHRLLALCGALGLSLSGGCGSDVPPSHDTADLADTGDADVQVEDTPSPPQDSGASDAVSDDAPPDGGVEDAPDTSEDAAPDDVSLGDIVVDVEDAHPETDSVDAVEGEDAASGSDASEDAFESGDCLTELVAIIRDFRVSHPDFEYIIGFDPGIVQPQLGADRKPVYAGDPTTPTTTGAANFDTWYRDVDGVNMRFEVPLPLTDVGDGFVGYQNNAFFPINGQGFGNEFQSRNFHFTTEVHTRFRYQGGEVIAFTGDDDLWVFVNDQLVIDLGGVHGPMSESVALDDLAGQIGIEVGGLFSLSLFHAERHTSESNFNFISTIDCLLSTP